MRAERGSVRTITCTTLLVLGLAVVPRAAFAFCRTTTVKAPADYDPAATGHCWSSGLPVYWSSTCISYDLQEAAGPSLSLAQASTALASAFAIWTGTTCTGSGGGPISMQVTNLGPVSCSVVEYNECGPNQHVIVFRDKWQVHDTANALALTTVTYDLDTGELYDADMEINASVPLSTATPLPANGYDFATVVTHETGHFLGLAHATLQSATMYAYLGVGETRRTLSSDDVDGICTIYPPNGTRSVATDAGPGVVDATACDPTPRHGFTSECMPTPVDGGVACEPPPNSGGCAVGGRPTDARPAWLAGVALLGLRRRRRP